MGCTNKVEDVSFLDHVGFDALGANGGHDDEQLQGNPVEISMYVFLYVKEVSPHA